MKLSIHDMKRYAREGAAWVGILLTTTDALHLPTNVRTTLLAVSGLLVAVEQGAASSKPKKPAV